MTCYMLGRRFSTEEWESICTRCGLCCYEKYEEAGKVVFTDVPCRYLGEDNLCKVYEKRQLVCEDCYEVTPSVVLEGDILPPECSYVQLAQQLAKEQLEALQRRGKGDDSGEMKTRSGHSRLEVMDTRYKRYLKRKGH